MGNNKQNTQIRIQNDNKGLGQYKLVTNRSINFKKFNTQNMINDTFLFKQANKKIKATKLSHRDHSA